MQKKSKFNVLTFMMLIILCFTLQPAISTYAACPDDIFSYWKLDESAGPDYADFIKDNDGTGSANVAAATGTVNGAQEFNGTDTQINVPADNSFDWQSDESFSIEFWVKIDSGIPANNEIIVGRDDAGTDLHWWVGIAGSAGGTVRFVLRDTTGAGAVVTGTSDVADGEWHHIVAVRDESTDDNILYVDGVEESRADPTVDYSAGFGSATAALNIGWINLTGGFYFDGLIDEVALYDRALTEEEIEDHYDAGLAGEDYCAGDVPFVPFPDDTISLWDLDEAAGPDYVDSFDGNDGTGSANVAAATGTVNGAQEFNGTDTQINVPADNSFDWQSDESFSIEFWVKIDSGIPAGNQIVIGRDDASTDLHWWVGIAGSAGGTVRFVLRDTTGAGAVVTGTSDVADGEWHHIVAVRDESTDDNILYVDGVEESRADPTVNYSAGFGSATAALNIGWINLTGGFYFDGLIDEVALYDRALASDEIEDHYEDGLEGIGIGDTDEDTMGIAEIIGTWSGLAPGIWYRDVAESEWIEMYPTPPDGDQIAAGDFTGDGKADVASIWGGKLWYQDGETLDWTKVPGTAPDSLTAGDVTGDGRAEIIGTWSGLAPGIWYRDVAESEWIEMYPTPPDGDQIAAGDFTGDGKADVASIWGGKLWYQDGETLAWTKVPGTAPDSLTAGDVTGDGRAEIIGTWSGLAPGIWYRDVAESEWIEMYPTPPDGDQIAAGDFTGDGKADVASIWGGKLWYQDGETLAWTKVPGTAPDSLTAGDVTGQ